MLNDRSQVLCRAWQEEKHEFERIVVSPVTLTSHLLEASANCPLLLEDLAVET